MRSYDDVPTLFTVNNVPVKARPGFWLMVSLVWALLAGLGMWRWPGQSVWAYIIVGGVGTLLAMTADVGHACAHTIGARMVDAPMKLILLGADMPRTLYPDDDVEPRQHIARSLGGPVYSWIGVGIGIAALLLTAPQTAGRYLAEIWTVMHGFIGGAIFAPLPIVDGGVVFKWLLVMRGLDEDQADAIIRRINVMLAMVLLTGAMAAALLGWWTGAAVMGMIAVVVGLVVTGILK